ALHEPLKALEELKLVETRQAHVIGGGTRKRTVIHLTTKGRQQFEAIASGSGFSIEASIEEGLYGREQELEKIRSLLDQGSVVLTGIPGIGKTALLQAISSDAKYVSMDSTMDAQNLVSICLGINDAPNDLESQVEMISTGELIIVDEVQEVHPRHRDGVFTLLEKLIEKKSKLVIGMRAPCHFEANITLEGIDAEATQKLLGENVDSNTCVDVCEALDGHPFALHLWNPSDGLPEANNEIQTFVDETILVNLSDSVRTDLDSLCLEPKPMLASHLDEIEISKLDNSALLRWPEGRVEVQHLIRNVRRVACIDPVSIHLEAVERWSRIADAEARWFEAYHRTMAGEDTTQFIVDNWKSLMVSSAATASLLEDALEILPDSEVLRRMAANLSLERGELDLASEYLDGLSEPDYSLLSRLYRCRGLKGAAEEAEKTAYSLLPRADVLRMKMSRIVGILDDSLPDEVCDLASVEKKIAEISLSEFANEEKKSVIVLMAIIKHRIALLKNDDQTAKKIREDLFELADSTDPIIVRMSHLERHHFAMNGTSEKFEAEAAMRRLVGRTSDSIQRISLGLTLVQAQAQTNVPGALTTLETLQNIPLPLDKPAGRRLDALIWFWKGQLSSNQRLTFWREAIFRFRRAECPNAAASLTARMHREL
ncbi:MAG: ATP-binding protein, partial [Candidatus Thermoplasmatota archaeon]|nr:ATP-binding protein [Candidatus Thermoplasmatota archaeon]